MAIVVMHVHSRALPVLLIASLLTLMGGPLLAATPHEFCQAMRHDCGKVDAIASCCCGDRSDNSTSQTSISRVELAPPSLGLAADVPTIVTGISTLVHEGLPVLARPPDFRILFSDLRI